MQTTLINAPIVGEFSSIKKDELTYMKQYNKETIVHNIFCIIIPTLINLGIICLSAFIQGVHPLDFANYDFPFSMLSFLLCILVYLFSFGCFWESLYDINSICEYSPKCQYAYYTEGKRVLKYDYETRESLFSLDYYLKLDLEDINTKKVSFATIGPFRSEIRTDISERTFDLDKKIVYIPYKS